MQRAFTFFQLMVVLAIIALLAALTMPVIASAKERAKVTKCVSNFQQWSAAIAMYRSDYDGDGKYGKATDMGLPPLTTWPIQRAYGVKTGPRVCEGTSPHKYPFPVYQHHWSNSDSWVTYVTEHRGESVMKSDSNHNQGKPVGSLYLIVQAIGLFEEGNTHVVRKRGDPHDMNWWN